MELNPSGPQGIPTDVVDLFPEGTVIDEKRGLVVGGMALTDLARAHGTPAYIVDEDALRARVQRFSDALTRRWSRSQVVFASKAFPSVAAYRLMADAGVGVDVAGPGELAAAIRGGVRPENLVVHGNAKTTAELEAAVDVGAGLVVVDNFGDIDRLERVVVGRKQDVLVRVVPDIHPDTYEAVATGQRGSKFGMPLEQAQLAIQRIRSSRTLRLAGVHAHIGSQILQPEPFVEAVRALAQLGEFETYDLGGGLGARYTYADRPPEPEEWIDAITTAAHEYLPASARLLIEPGRSIVARSGITLYRVVNVKESDGRTIVAVDGGMGDNLDVALYGQRFEATVVDRVGGGELVDVVGRHCESGDRITTDVLLRSPEVDDIVAVPVTGAYCYTMANNYNGALRPPVIFCSRGSDRVVVRRETLDDYFARDVTAESASNADHHDPGAR